MTFVFERTASHFHIMLQGTHLLNLNHLRALFIGLEAEYWIHFTACFGVFKSFRSP